MQCLDVQRQLQRQPVHKINNHYVGNGLPQVAVLSQKNSPVRATSLSRVWSDAAKATNEDSTANRAGFNQFELVA